MRVEIKIEWCHDTTFRLANGAKRDSLNPKEMLLYATAECAGITIMSILAKERVKPKSLEIEMSGELEVSHAIRLANDTYCGTLQMMRKIAPVSNEIAIVSSESVEV